MLHDRWHPLDIKEHFKVCFDVFDQAQLRRLNVALVELLGGRDGDALLGLERADLSVC